MSFFLKKEKILKKFVTVTLAVLMAAALVPTMASAEDSTISVTTQKDITDALATAVANDTITFEVQNDLVLGNSGAVPLLIPKGVNVILTNADGVNVKISRYPLNSGATSRFDINGTLTINENTSSGGSLTFSGEHPIFEGQKVDFKGNPIFAVYGEESALTINGGTFKNHNSYFGMIYSVDGATTTITGGTFNGNENKDRINGNAQGGLIWAINSNLNISGGLFENNVAGGYGGVVFYSGRTADHKMVISGGEFNGNSSEGFGGGAIYVECETDAKSLVEISGSKFTNNKTNGLGGALYITVGSEVLLSQSYITENHAGINGGGFWNCPTGGAELYTFRGLYMAENTADSYGADFYSEFDKTNPEVKPNVFLSDYAFTGDKIDWIIDDASEKKGTLAPNEYYQNINETIGLKSSLDKKDTLLTRSDVNIFTGNEAKSGGAIANNSYVVIGEPVNLTINKVTTIESTDDFTFNVFLTRDNSPITGSFAYKKGDETSNITFDENGKGSVSLKSGESVTITDLPVNIKFKVEEAALTNWTINSMKGAEDVIPADAENTPVFTASFVNKPYVYIPYIPTLTVPSTDPINPPAEEVTPKPEDENAEDTLVPEDETDKTSEDKDKDKDKDIHSSNVETSTPKTGDTSMPAMWIGGMLASLIVIIGLVLGMKKHVK